MKLILKTIMNHYMLPNLKIRINMRIVLITIVPVIIIVAVTVAVFALMTTMTIPTIQQQQT
jgi:uncharacterized membrane protein